ncbi:MAG: hypothetical protein KF704_09170 [Crocinitomicaceae bacterium]|nr:hypothetical protein [Crocinitomicaceae bacterium]NGF74510.1 hypothetical protein [Fluviicola sp. SGL-29]
MKQVIFFLSLITFVACKSNEGDVDNKTPEKVTEDYEKVEGGNYRAFYGSNDQLKTEGMYDESGKKHGVWIHYFPDGRKQSVLEYKHGVKDGFSVVYHANGSIYYSGEYRNDKMIGIWDFYDTETGKKSHTKDYGTPEFK